MAINSLLCSHYERKS